AVEGHGLAEEVQQAYAALASRGELSVRAHLALSPSWGGSDTASCVARLEQWRPQIAGRGRGDAFLSVAGLVAEANPTPDNAARRSEERRVGKRGGRGWRGSVLRL